MRNDGQSQYANTWKLCRQRQHVQLHENVRNGEVGDISNGDETEDMSMASED